jgi:putative flavoprotein involved in K+ transport
VTSCEGLYFLGLPWQYTWGSGRFCGVGADARYLAAQIAAGPLHQVPWLAGTRASTWPRAEETSDWIAPRTVA